MKIDRLLDVETAPIEHVPLAVEERVAKKASKWSSSQLVMVIGRGH